ncbi:MAG: DUF2520 domain-containing protein [Acidimicrobiales bacterium]
MPAVRIIGPGRAGRALARALASAGWSVDGVLGRTDPPALAAAGVDLLVIATPDAAVAAVALSVEPTASCVVAHMAGSLPLAALAPHQKRASLHPLRAIPSPATSLAGAWFAVAGDPLAVEAVEAIGGRPVPVADHQRASYHAAATVAANHVVALAGQVERIAAEAGLSLDLFIELMRDAIDNVQREGPRAALTGPVARGDWTTVEAHLAAIEPSERPGYLAMALEAARLVERDVPPTVAAVERLAANRTGVQ